MRVLHVTNMYPTPARPFWGCFVRSLVEGLGRCGIENEVLLVDGRSNRLNYLRGMFALRRRLRAGSFDLIHAHYGLTGVIALAQRRTPFVPSLYGSDVHVPWQRRLTRVATNAAAETVVCSRQMAEILAVARTPSVIPPGIDVSFFVPQPQVASRCALGFREDEKVVLFAASPSQPVKDFALFQKAIAVLGCVVRVVTLGDVAQEVLPRLYSAVDCVVLTSKSEGSPTVIKEAIACGCRIVSVDVGDVAESLRGVPDCSVVHSRDPAEVAAHIRVAIGHDGPRAAVDVSRFSIGVAAEKMRAIYERVLR